MNTTQTSMMPVPAVSQARLQAWLVNLLTLIVEAYELGAVVGHGARVTVNDVVLAPSATYIQNEIKSEVSPTAIRGSVALAVDVLHSGVSETDRAALRKRYEHARVLEYWQIIADKGAAHFFQSDANGNLESIPPDKGGLYFSAAIVHLAFPVEWFRKLPTLLEMMDWWGLIELEKN